MASNRNLSFSKYSKSPFVAKDKDEYYKESGVTNLSNLVPSKKKKEEPIDMNERIIDWTTFYRRNIHRFIEHYFGIKLHFFQIIMIYLMDVSPTFTAICARSVSKSFITALYACAICILRPNSEVLVTSKTKKQAGLNYKLTSQVVIFV